MARNIVTTITAYDYKDLRQEYSEKNIINQTFGNEFVITASNTVLEHIDDTVKPNEISISPLTADSQVSDRDAEEADIKLFGGLVQSSLKVYLRDEWFYTPISFAIETEQVLVDEDINNISLKTTITYDKYHSVNGSVESAPYMFVSESNWKSWYAVYAKLLNFPAEESDLTAEENLPFQHSRCQVDYTDQYTPKTLPPNTVKIQSCKKINRDGAEHFEITVAGELCTWWGYNYSKTNKFAILEEEATVLVAKKVEFTISANTIDERELEFTYSRDLINNRANAQGKNYNLETNEFIQTDETTETAERTSFKISKQIFDGFDQDRSIVSFTLLNCEKYQIDNEVRYLRSGDLIMLQDEHGEMICDEISDTGELVESVFEIIKTRPIWDGSFSMEVVCKKIDMTAEE